MYVNYGRVEDFQRLERTLGVNVTGKIAIARYGKIFRGDKVTCVIITTINNLRIIIIT